MQGIVFSANYRVQIPRQRQNLARRNARECRFTDGEMFASFLPGLPT
jgi:hypothetical protein